MADKRTEGWGGLDNAKMAHFFRAGRSLCGNWLAWGEPRWEKNQALGSEPDGGTCKACWRKRAKEENSASTTVRTK